MSDGTGSWHSTAKKAFAGAKDFKDIVGVIWREGRDLFDYYQHYTTLSSVITKIGERHWWLSRSDSERLNDGQESQKFGVRRYYRRTYQTSFVYGSSESAALWGMYAPGNPFALRITIPGNAIRNWVEELKHKSIHSKNNVDHPIDEVDFKDIIYAAVGFTDQNKTRLDRKRHNILHWSGESTSEIPDLEKEIKNDECSGWLKDYEWRHENESRLCVRIKKAIGATSMWIPISAELLESMSFTFSPWLDKSYESQVEDIISTVYKRLLDKKDLNLSSKFHRSVLQGALRLSYGVHNV